MPNALQITDPNADNPLAQAPSWADAYGSVAGTVSGGVDALGQWLAAQRAKQWQRQNGMPGFMADKLANMPPTTARVPPDTLSDVDPTAAPAPVDVGNEGTSPIYPSNPTQLVDRLIHQDVYGQSFNYAQAIQRAMDNRRRLGRGQ